MSTIAPQRPGGTRTAVTSPSVPAPWRRALWAVFAVSGVLGSIGVVIRLLEGHLPAGYGSYVPWGLWVAIYSHGVGIAGGALAIATLLHLFRVPGFTSPTSLRVATVLVAAAVLPALLAVGFDLGRMDRAWRLLATPSFESLIAFNTWTYLALLAVSAAIWWLSFRPDSGWLRPFVVLGLLLAVMTPSQGGAFFGVVGAKPYWNDPLLPVLLLVSAITSGAAVLLFVRALTADRDGRLEARQDVLESLRVLRWIVLGGIVAYFFLEFAGLSTALWNRSTDAAEVSLVLSGPFWWVFWIVHLVLGGLVAGSLLLTRRPLAWVAAGGLVGATFLSGRLNLIVPGQAVSELRGLQEAFVHPRLEYTYQATGPEYLVALFCLFLAMVIFSVGTRLSGIAERRMAEKEVAHATR